MEISLFMMAHQVVGRTYRDIVVEKEQDPQYNAKWESDAHPFAIEVPEPDKPFSSIRSLESATHRESGCVCRAKMSPVRHTRGSDERYRHAIICKENTDSPTEIVCL